MQNSGWDSFLGVWTPRLLSILRIVAAFLFMEHGTQKLFGFPGGSQPVPWISLPGFAGVLESLGGMLLLLGCFTRPVAFVLSGEMAFAYFMRHAALGFFPLLNRGELSALYSFLFLYLAAAGGGPWSLDALMRRKLR